MKYESTQIISRIEWCRLQQQLHSVTGEERAGWWAEEAGLADALRGRDRTAVMREEHRSQFMRYKCGLEDGTSLLRLSTSIPCGMTLTSPSAGACGVSTTMTCLRYDP